MVTWDNFVVPDNGTVQWRTMKQQYEFFNGSTIVIGGMDKPSKIMSTEYDIIYVMEATEIRESDWEMLTTRARFGRMPYNQVIGCCNPASAGHWIKKRGDRGSVDLINTTHRDNPVLWDRDKQEWTPKGQDYVSKLERLTGVRALRLYKGLWASSEGLIYPEFNPDVHIIPRRLFGYEYDKFVTVDFGYTNPFVAQFWALDKDEERIYMYREIYFTGRTVREHASQISDLTRKEYIPVFVCDWDAEDRATLEENGFFTEPATKAISPGIQTVKDWLIPDESGKPKIYFCDDSVVETDADLEDNFKPTKTVDEFDTYVWVDNDKKDVPSDKDNHGMDALRYAVMYADTFVGNGGIFV